MAKDTWELVAEDVPAAEGIELGGRRLHLLVCPNGHYLVLNSPYAGFDPKQFGGSLPCVRCPAHWPVPVEN